MNRVPYKKKDKSACVQHNHKIKEHNKNNDISHKFIFLAIVIDAKRRLYRIPPLILALITTKIVAI